MSWRYQLVSLLIVLTIVGTIVSVAWLLGNEFTNRERARCEARGGHLIKLTHDNICISPDGRIINNWR